VLDEAITPQQRATMSEINPLKGVEESPQIGQTLSEWLQRARALRRRSCFVCCFFLFVAF
jgi:hypothetical protein